MRRKWSAPTYGKLSRSRPSGSLVHRFSNAHLQQMLLVLLLLTAGMLLWMGSNHYWPDLHSLLEIHPGFTPELGTSASSSNSSSTSAGAKPGARARAASDDAAVPPAVRQPPTLQTFGESLEFPLWWHAPFISQSGAPMTAADLRSADCQTDETCLGVQSAATRDDPAAGCCLNYSQPLNRCSCAVLCHSCWSM